MQLLARSVIVGLTAIAAGWFVSTQVAHSPALPLSAPESNVTSTPSIPITATFTLPILALHHVGPAPASLSASAKTWYISEEKFRKLLDEVKAWDLHPMTASELLASIESGFLPERAILITFDDGAVDFYTNAFPLLQEYNVPAVMHLQSHVRSAAWLSEAQIRGMANSGLVEFGSHTKYHQYLTRVSEAEAREELEGSKKKIEDVLGDENAITSLAYPFGLYNDAVKQWASDAGYQMAFTIDGGATQHSDDLMALTRIIITETSNISQLFSSYYEQPE